MGGEALKKNADKQEKAGEVTPFPDATQAALAGLKPKAIQAVEAEFEKVLTLKDKKAATDKALKDAKERLY